MARDINYRCEHGLLRPCEECDPYQFARWMFSRLHKESSPDILAPERDTPSPIES